MTPTGASGTAATRATSAWASGARCGTGSPASWCRPGCWSSRWPSSPTPLRPYAPVAFAGLGAVALFAWWLGRRQGAVAFVGHDLRALLRPGVAVRVVAGSCASTAGHVAVFLVAVAVVGVDATPALLVAIALAVLVGSAVPLSIAGWGPREGVTAGVFALAGLGSTTGLTVSVVFGVLAGVATVPGVLVLLADAVVRRRRPTIEEQTPALEEARRG